MKLGKKIVALLLGLCLLAGAVPVGANAAEGDKQITFVYGNSTNARSGDSIPSPGSILSAEEWLVLMYTNMERAAAGLEPVTAFAQIQAACDVRAVEIGSFFSHTRPDGRECFTALDEAGMEYGAAGENIACGFTSADRVMTQWMKSDGHRGNILGGYTHMGVGYDTSGLNWVQMFAAHWDEVYTECYVMTPSVWDRAAGTTIEELGMYAVLKSSVYGLCYLPIISEYCTGYDPSETGTQLVRMSFLGFSGFIVMGEHTGLMECGGDLYYVSGTDIDWSYTGLTTYNGTWYYVRNGAVDWNYNGLVQHTNGGWFYVKGGKIAWSYTGVVQHTNGGMFYVKKGRIDWTYTGFAQNADGSMYYIKKGSVDKSRNGLVQHSDGRWLYVKNGQVDRTYTGLVQHTNGGWYYVKNGQIDWTYTGLVQHTNGSWYYVKNGAIAWSFTGLVQHTNGGWFYVQKGRIAWTYTGLVQHTNGGWFYVQKGMINWRYTGLVPHNGGLFYVRSGQINWSYNGTCEYNGETYTVVNGVARKA